MTTPHVPHRFELELTVPGTPEQVWDAIATADGISAWMTPAEIEPREGGALAFHMGPEATSHGRVVAYEPNRRLVYEEDWATLVGQPGADVTPLLTEFLVEAQSGGTCVVRVVTSAFGVGADWEHEFWGEMDLGWAPMLDNLRLYLTHFPGQRVTPMWVGTTFAATTPEEAVARVRGALGIAGGSDRVDARGVTGRVERSIDRHFLVRLETPVTGLLSFFSFGDDGGSAVHAQAYLFGDGATDYVAREQQQWQAWIDSIGATEATRT